MSECKTHPVGCRTAQTQSCKGCGRRHWDLRSRRRAAACRVPGCCTGPEGPAASSWTGTPALDDSSPERGEEDEHKISDNDRNQPCHSERRQRRSARPSDRQIRAQIEHDSTDYSTQHHGTGNELPDTLQYNMQERNLRRTNPLQILTVYLRARLNLYITTQPWSKQTRLRRVSLKLFLRLFIL